MTYLAELFTVSVSGTSRRNVLGAIAFEKNDCNFPWRRQPRRVRKKRKRQAQQQKNRRLRPAPPLCKNPDEDRFSLTVSFRNGHIDEWHLVLAKAFQHFMFDHVSWLPEKCLSVLVAVFGAWGSYRSGRSATRWTVMALSSSW